MMKPLLWSLLFSLALVACRKTDVRIEDNSAKTIYNVSYGSDTAQRMDVYLPANRSTATTKVMVMIHGGAWTSGDKTELNAYVPEFKQRFPDYALFNINYRLAQLPNTNVFPTQENDVKAAINFILTKDAEYKFNKDRLVILGASAGGHLGGLQAYKQSTPRVKAFIDMFGPAEMVSLYGASNVVVQLGLQQLLSGTPITNPSLYFSSSPLNFVTAQSPPTLILHGGVDPLVPVSQSNALYAKLQTLGVASQLVVYPTEGHSWVGPNLTDTYSKIEAFLKIHNP